MCKTYLQRFKHRLLLLLLLLVLVLLYFPPHRSPDQIPSPVQEQRRWRKQWRPPARRTLEAKPRAPSGAGCDFLARYLSWSQAADVRSFQLYVQQVDKAAARPRRAPADSHVGQEQVPHPALPHCPAQPSQMLTCPAVVLLLLFSSPPLSGPGARVTLSSPRRALTRFPSGGSSSCPASFEHDQRDHFLSSER
eukprot:753497-Hanusia_phi.AAC.1